MKCAYCASNTAQVVCGHGDPCLTLYCGQACANADYGNHALICLAVTEGPWPKWRPESTDHRNRGYYKASIARLEMLRKRHLLVYIYLADYARNAWVNRIMYAAKDNWNAFAVQTNPVDTIAQTIASAATLLGPRNVLPVKSLQELMQRFPSAHAELQQPPALIVRAICNAIQNAITGMPPLRAPVFSFRGYVAINAPGTLAVDVKQYRVGQVIVNWSFLSVSLDKRIAAGFALRTPCCVMRIRIPSNFPVLMISSDGSDPKFPHLPVMPTELELLLPAGTQLRMGKRVGQKTYSAVKYGPMTGTAGMPPPAPPSMGPVHIDTIEAEVVGRARIKGYVKRILK